jgi:hypothetical protein
MSEGLVVASCGWKACIRSKSPVSATTVVSFLSCSNWLNAEAVLFMGLLDALKWFTCEYHMIDGLITQFQ